MNRILDLNQGTEVWADWVQLPSGQRRYVHQWSPHEQLRGQVMVIHGLGEHGGRYIRLAPYLAKSGFRVAAWDLPGHGRSPGKRGAIKSYQALLEEIHFSLSWLSAKAPQLPTVLFGHSMGGNLAVNYALRGKDDRLWRMPDAIIASSPMFISPKEPKGLMNIVARTAAKTLPHLAISAGTETRQLTDDPAEQQLLDNDPFFHRRLTLRMGAALIDSGRWAIENANRLELPMLLTHGLKDRITLPEGSQQFAERAGPLCRLHLLEDHLHESFRDQRRHQVIELYVDFLESLTGSQRTAT